MSLPSTINRRCLRPSIDDGLNLKRAHSAQMELQRQNDRLSLLLEINNHIVTLRDIDDLFRAASVPVRKYFAHDFTSFSFFDERSNCFTCMVVDLPGGRRFTAPDVEVTQIPEEHLERLRNRVAIVDHFNTQHLSPQQAGKIAAEAGVRRLVFTHLGIPGPTDAEAPKLINEAHETFKGEVIVPEPRYALDANRTYSLAELIDLAETHNPDTRVAWQNAKARAQSVGVAESELFPTISAVALANTTRDAGCSTAVFIGKRSDCFNQRSTSIT